MPDARPHFEVGFVLAGAISAGCYSAGVMDFLIEALDDYDAERDRPGWNGPTHDVRVPVLAGASAGGMTAAMAALHMFRDFDHVQPAAPPPPAGRNRLYSSWVTDISIERLLELGDLGSGGLRSALCSDVLDRILADAFRLDGAVVRRPWVGRGDGQLLVMTTLTNLRGVPYSFELVGAGAGDRFGMTNHADVGAFRLAAGMPANGQACLDVGNTGDDAWAFFKVAALATGAFPVGLAPRFVERPGKDYLSWGTVGRIGAGGGFEIIAPDDRFEISKMAEFWAVDGGTIDNEPLEQARRYLTEGQPDQADGGRTSRSVVLIAPFPNFHALEKDPVTSTLVTALPGLFSALIAQARFKPDELAKAYDGSDFSRFIIAPVRQRPDGTSATYAIASGALGGFSGFFHESFRRHDYLLGRRNAQAFLRWNFGLPTTNGLFKGAEIDPSWRIRDAGAEKGSVRPGAEAGLPVKTVAVAGNGQAAKAETALYPIIPLTERLRQPIEIGAGDAARPDAVSLDGLRPRLRGRIEGIVGTLVDTDFRSEIDERGKVLGYLARKGAKVFGTEVASRKAEKAIAAGIEALKAAFP